MPVVKVTCHSTDVHGGWVKTKTDCFYLFIYMFKVEYHANEYPLKNSEKNNICWWKVNVSNNQKYKNT